MRLPACVPSLLSWLIRPLGPISLAWYFAASVSSLFHFKGLHGFFYSFFIASIASSTAFTPSIVCIGHCYPFGIRFLGFFLSENSAFIAINSVTAAIGLVL